MFFENVWESELSQCIDKDTREKVIISSGSYSEELLEDVADDELPAIYGGSCECQATCIYSDKGPWSDCENLINFKEPKAVANENDDISTFKALFGNVGPKSKPVK